MSVDIERIEALFDRAIGFRPEERAAFLAGACGQDTVLLARVRALLEAHEAGDGILVEEPRREATRGLGAAKPGDRIGHYKLLERRWSSTDAERVTRVPLYHSSLDQPGHLDAVGVLHGYQRCYAVRGCGCEQLLPPFLPGNDAVADRTQDQTG